MKIQLPASNENTRVYASLGPQAMPTGDTDLCWGCPWGLMPVLHSALGAQEAGLLVLSHSWVNPVEKSDSPGFFFQTSIPAFAEWPDLVTSSWPPAPCGLQPAGLALSWAPSL